MLTIYDLTTEYQTNPLGLDVKNPAFSWKLNSEEKDIRQTACQILVSQEGSLVYDSGKVETGESLYHKYQGAPLQEVTRYDLTVKVWDNHENCAEAKGFFETGYFDWTALEAQWITHGFEDSLEPCAVFEKTFSLKKQVLSARAYATALGLYTLEVNHRRVGEYRLTPGWTAYQKQLQVQTYDLTEYLAENNTVSMTVGNGWYKGILGFYGQGNHYGNRTAVLCQVEILYTDGSREVMGTDPTWTSTTASRRYSEIYHGEVIDYSLEAQEVRPAAAYTYPKENLVGQINEPVTITQRVPVQTILHSPKGETILDFGQNLTGVVEVKLKAPKGTKILLRHAETLDEKGNLFTTNLRTAKATDTYICSGHDDVFLPEFTYHGFRYVAVEGLEDPDPKAFTACVLTSGFRRTGTFSCSNEKINQLWRNIDWTMRSNYLDVPMDCPQRDERLGYTGDAEIFLPTALFHGELPLFYRKWLRDLRIEQTDEFGIPLSVPDILRTRTCVSIWHEAATIVPWMVYQTYGDQRLLEEQYDSMKRSVEYTKRLAGEKGLLMPATSSQFGDWVALDAPKGPYRKTPEGIMHPSNEEKGGGSDLHLIGNVYYLYSIDIMAKTAGVLGKTEEARKWQELYQTVRALFRKEYITAAGRLVGETQTAMALVLYFNLVEGEERKTILENLKLNLIKNKKHLYTGFVGTEYLPHVLSESGLHQLMGDILFKEDCPSWLYEVNLGATTVWELWDGVNEDGSFNLFEMNSLNQYGFATIGDWMVKRLAGLKALEAGYRSISLRPSLVKGITSVHLNYETPYGRVGLEMSCEKGVVKATVEIPANTTCQLTLPEKQEMTLGSGTYTFEYETGLSYEKELFSEDSRLGELLAHPEAETYFMEKAPELANSGFIRTFVSNLTIIEIKMLLPRSFVPQYAVDLFEEMIELLNKQYAVKE